MAARTTRAGTQSIERAIGLLREVSTRHRVGWRLSDLAARCQLDVGTAHRILDCLVRERLLKRRPDDRHYLPGPLMFEIGLALRGYADLQAASRPALIRVAGRFHGLALLNLRSGSEFVCIGRAGEPLYRGALDEVGTRRPLIATASGVSILTALPQPEASEIAAENARSLMAGGATNLRALQGMMRRAQTSGYAFNRGETARGIHALSVALFDSNKQAFGSLTIAAKSTLLPFDGAESAAEMLLAEAKIIERHAARLLSG